MERNREREKTLVKMRRTIKQMGQTGTFTTKLRKR
jgi:hypothetical protein